MAAIYQADVWCDDCADSIKDRICSELWSDRGNSETPDGTAVAEFASRDDLYDHLIFMDERQYDSDEFPKYCDDDEECDCPQHCADCGYFFGNSLTTDGADYVRETVREDVESGCVDSVACTVWMPYYDWIDYGDVGTCDDCGSLAVLNDEELCSGCARWFINRYVCPDCEEEWDSEWSCACDDECPVCGECYSPVESEEVSGRDD
jgi:hypothetical protein